MGMLRDNTAGQEIRPQSETHHFQLRKLTMAYKRQSTESPHEQAVAILEKHLQENLGGTLEAPGQCMERLF